MLRNYCSATWCAIRRRCLVVGVLCVSALSPWSPLHAQSVATGVEVRPLFSPWDDVEGALIAEIAAAVQSVHVHAYLLTSRPITQALVAAQRRGVGVSVVADAEMASRGAVEQLDVLAQAGVPVWMETRYAAAHNKVLILDAGGARPVVVTGSYNFTWSAQARNAENVVIIRGDTEVSARYLHNWWRHQREATPYRAWRSSLGAERKKPHAE